VTPTDLTDVSTWLDVLAGSHDRLCDLVGDLNEDSLRQPSYCDDWTIAQVLSHIGSGAEIFAKYVDATVAGDPPPSRDTFPEVWARWNALPPREVAEAAISTDGSFVEKVENLGEALEALEFKLFGVLDVDGIGLLRVRLSEHALHTWDIAVALDPRALVDADAVNLLIDGLPRIAGRLGKAERLDGTRPRAIRVVTSDPGREFDFEIAETVTMTRVGDGGGGSSGDVVHLPAEGLLRLVYGRLDPTHAPAVRPDEAATLDALRSVFPGI
jgi:uncharacterized protein (TIGR03083 family)